MSAPRSNPQVEVAAAGERAAIARRLLEGLPQWFGLAGARENYIRESTNLHMVVVREDGDAVGFATLRPHSAVAAELHLIAVAAQRHRRGLGSALLDSIERLAAERGFRFLTVKTLAPSHPDPGYARTRRFYEASGFLALELLPTLWGAENPCLMMIKPLAGRP